MPTSATGHRQDVRPKHVKIDEELWKQCQSLEKPDGCELHVVDGDRVRIDHDMDFNQGGNGLEDSALCSRKQLCLDDGVQARELPFIAYHEALERREMLKGKSYDAAHKIANDHERQLRKDYPPKLKVTRLVGYIETPVPKKCGTCEYYQKPGLCNQVAVKLDPQMKTDQTGLKIVDGENGCCDLWEAK